MMRMCEPGGAVMVAVFGALLAAAHPKLSQVVDELADEADSSTDEMFQCYARYMRTLQEHGVLVVHGNHTEVNRYVARIRSPLSIINIVDLDDVLPLLPSFGASPYGLLVLLAATPKEITDFVFLLGYFSQSRDCTGALIVGMAHANGANLHEIFAVATKFFLSNVAVLTWNDTRVYTRFPFGDGECGQRQLPEVLGACQQLSLDQLYPEKLPMRFNGCAVKSPAVGSPPPAVIDVTSDSEQPLVAGYELALINLIFGRLNLTRDPSQLVAWISYKSGYPYYVDTLSWYVPVAEPRAQWKSVVQVFQAPLWFTILAFFLFNALAWWLVGTGGYAECVLGSLVTLLNGSVRLPRRTHRRFLVVSWTLCTLVLVAAYQSQLLSVLLTPVAEPQPITNEQELLASDMPINYIVLAYVLLDNSPAIWDHDLKTQHSNKPQAVLQLGLTVKYMARNFTDAHGKPTLVAFKRPVKYVPVCLNLDSRSPIMVPVNRMLQQLMENGIVAKFMRDVDFSGYMAAGGSKDEPLTMGHLDFAFLLLLMGCALAIVAFLLETVVWRTQHGWWRVLSTTVRSCGTRVRGCLRTCTTSIRRWWQRTRFLRRRRTFRRRMLAQVN